MSLGPWLIEAESRIYASMKYVFIGQNGAKRNPMITYG